MIERAANAADLGIKAHAHVLRHACGYKLANDLFTKRARSRRISGIATVGIRYGRGAAAFKEFFRD
jgi:hypothetical protein